MTALLSLLFASAAAHAGPPLVTDDPGVLEPGQWEIIGAVTYTETTEGSVTQLPLLDVSYGVTENVQFSAAYPYVFVNPDNDSSDDDFGNLALGAKWLFWQDERTQIAIGGVYTFGISLNSARRGVGDDQDLFYVPLLLEYSFDSWRLNLEFGYESIKNEQDGLAYGAAAIFPAGARMELLFELQGGADTSFDDDILSARAGIDFAWTKDLHLLFSLGTGLTEPDEVELDYDLFFGVQYFR